jgi:hypothetical protein
MNIQEGARRMRRVGVWLALIPASLLALALCFQIASLFRTGVGTIVSGVAFVGGLGIGEIILAATPGALLWVAAWIVEGFAKDSD